MSSSISGFPPVAKLCSNCQKAQFRDDVPQLFQDGSRLEFPKEQVPPHWRPHSWGIIPTEFEFMDSFPELPKLVKSGRDGCDFCCFLHGAITLAASEQQDISTAGRARIIFVHISYVWGPPQEESISSDQSLSSGESLSSGRSLSEWPIGLHAMRIDFEVSSDENISESIFTLDCAVQSLCDSICWMKQRLELCQEEHDHDVFDKTFIPRRLINVSLETPRLAMRKDILQSGRSSDFKYAALSYCWGSGESQAKTTSATLNDRQAGISATEMPPTLRDAIRVTRALGISFLWVDALCILQDDISDWEQQCAEMHTIYGSAQVTLCVANTRSCNEGFLQQTSPYVRIPFQSLREPDIAGSFLVQYINLVSGDRYRIRPPIYQSRQLLHSDVGESQWHQRGWVFQENKISYDASRFSYAADILPALSGLARLFKNRLKDCYYAGHWGRDLYRSLAWEGFTSYSLPVQPPGNTISSWSRLAKGPTASYAYHRYGIERDFRSEINVTKARVVTVGDNPFGALKECRLWIRGYTLDMGRRELQISAQPKSASLWGRWHLVVHGCCFGHFVFDWQPGHNDLQKTCPSRDDVREFKVLLLGSFEEYISKGVPGSEGSERSSIENDQDSAPKEKSGDESLDHSEQSCEEELCSQEQTRDQETSTLGDDDSGHRQFQVAIRRGYGLIISPTGNDGEFRRVGAIFPGKGSHQCELNGDSNLEALQGLAQIETVQSV
ncbi:HET-domain-containing protein [Diaporthe eres]|nr:HET-domain-containing protein [Diaporthe eres]